MADKPKQGKDSGDGVADFGGKRDLTVRVKTARGRSKSSTKWLQRQLNDPYVTQAKKDGYRSRAAYKIIELDNKFNFLTKKKRILDLGAAPGGWTQIAIDRTGASPEHPNNILAVDILEMEPLAGSQFIQLDFMDDSAPDVIKKALGGKVDVLMSDIAPNTTGHGPTDHLRIMMLCEMAYDLATEVLAKDGIFLCKVRQGGTENELLTTMKKNFTKVVHAKPKSSRKGSSETYVVAIGFKGN